MSLTGTRVLVHVVVLKICENRDTAVLRSVRVACRSDASTFKLRWMVKGLEKKLKAEAAAYKGESAAGADVVNEILEMVKEPLDRLLKDFTEVRRTTCESLQGALPASILAEAAAHLIQDSGFGVSSGREMAAAGGVVPVSAVG